MRREIKAGSVSQMLGIFVYDSSKTDGSGLAGLVYNTASLVAEYRREGQSSWTAISLVAGTLGTFTSGGFVADGSLGGAYEFCPPDAAFNSGVAWVQIRLRGAANMEPVLIEVTLIAVDKQDAARLGLTALPPAAAGANGGLPLGDGSGRVTLVDKTGFALTSAYDPAKTAAQAGDAMTLTPAERTTLFNGIWGHGSRTLSSFGTLVADLATAVWTYGARALTDKLGFGLSSAERTAIANAVEAEIIDDTDSEKVLQAIVDKIAAVNPDLSGLTVAAIASAVWANATRELTSGAGISLAKGTGITGFNDLNAAGIRTAIGLATANLDTQLSAILAAAGNGATEAEIAAMFTQIKGAGWSNETLKALYDKPAAELSPADLADISAAIIAALAAEGVTVNQLTAGAIAQLATKRAFYLLSPLNECGRYRIVRGQDCFAVDGRSLDLPNPQGDWPNLTGASIKVTCSHGTTSLTLDGSVVVPTGSGQLVRGEPASAFTQQLTEGEWTLDFEAVLPGTAHVVPLGRFKLEVLRRNRPL